MKAKKSLGQNFLTSKDIAKDIIFAADISDGDTILEVGPGKGFLTEELLKASKKVVAIEKDLRLIEYLGGRFSKEIKNKKLIIIHKDILDFLKEEGAFAIVGENFKVVANIPYYITGQLLRMFLENKLQPPKIVLMLQKEVAERIVANDNKESILSISVKAYGTPEIIKIVQAKYFNPKPKVDSAILVIRDISKKHFTSNEKEKEFFQLVKQGFLHKRKTLLGNLKICQPACPVGRPARLTNFENTFGECDIDLKIRAERLDVKDWLCLQRNLKR